MNGNFIVGRKHLLIPDTQVKPGVCTDHLEALGNYIVEKKPDVIVHIGDHADLPSLSFYDKPGSKAKEGARYVEDVKAAQAGMDRLFAPINAYNEQQRQNHGKLYTPRLEFCLGNHENRITRAIEADPVRFEGKYSLKDLDYERWGWHVNDFLDVVIIDGIAYSHYFVNPDALTGNPLGGQPQYKLGKMKCSFVMGHQQGAGDAQLYTGIGTRLRGLVCGSFYMHDEDYLGPQKNRQYWRGLYMLHEVNDGDFNLCEVSMNYLLRKYL